MRDFVASALTVNFTLPWTSTIEESEIRFKSQIESFNASERSRHVKPSSLVAQTSGEGDQEGVSFQFLSVSESEIKSKNNVKFWNFRRVEEAVQYHKEAAEILNSLLQTIIDEKVAESVRLQAQLHEKEHSILRHQKKRAEQVYRDLESLRRMAEKTTSNNKVVSDSDNLQLSIYRKFEETESLLDQLRIHDDGSSSVISSEAPAPPAPKIATPYQNRGDEHLRNSGDLVIGHGSKKPKDEKVIIEELQVANSHLRKMVDSLFFELGSSQRELSSVQRENLELKARLRHLEQQQGGDHQQVAKGVEIQAIPVQHHHISQSAQPSPQPTMRTFKPAATAEGLHHLATPNRSLRAAVVASPIEKRRLQQQEEMMQSDETSLQSSSTIAEDVELPPLPPLEMPAFNFDK